MITDDDIDGIPLGKSEEMRPVSKEDLSSSTKGMWLLSNMFLLRAVQFLF